MRDWWRPRSELLGTDGPAFVALLPFVAGAGYLVHGADGLRGGLFCYGAIYLGLVFLLGPELGRSRRRRLVALLVLATLSVALPYVA